MALNLEMSSIKMNSNHKLAAVPVERAAKTYCSVASRTCGVGVAELSFHIITRQMTEVELLVLHMHSLLRAGNSRLMVVDCEEANQPLKRRKHSARESKARHLPG